MAHRHLSGIQPSGLLHLGNYFGAIRAHVQSQDDGFYFIANYHALTTVQDAAALRAATFDVAATYLACGLEPERAVLYRQSDVPEVCELMWLLLTVTGAGLLEKGVSFKDKKARGLPASAGLLTYPVLQAADILAVDAAVVPVGADQVQHIEFARDMAQSFNHLYGEVFVLPTFRLGTPVLVPGIDGQKMSKSYDNHIPIFATGKALRKRVMSIVTEPVELEAPKDPDRCTVFALYKLMASPEEAEAMARAYRAGGYGFGHAKQALYERIEEYFAPMRERRARLEAHPEEVERVLALGAERARAVVRATTARARRAVGLD